MTWFKIDDALHSHPKWLAASPEARALWVTAGSWCAAHLTDGHIPRHVLPMFAAKNRDAAELVRVGLWGEESDGWTFHDWDDFQPSAESVEAERKASRERQRRARDRSRESRRDIQRDDNRESRRDIQRDDNRESHRESRSPASRREFGPPDPTRPDQYVKGGENLQTAPDPTAPPPLRCPEHADTDGPVPPCGACADARRAHDAWTRQHGNGTRPDPYADMQAAARLRAEANQATARDIANEPPDPEAATRINQLLKEHRLATKQDPG